MNMAFNKNIKSGLYLVADPKPGLDIMLPKISKAIKGGCDIIQIWNNWSDNQDKLSFINSVCKIAHQFNIPVLINEEWEWLKSTPLDGVHFDKIPANFNRIRNSIKHPFLSGITCGNDISIIEWANNNNMDYVSFCSMFPSSSASDCEIVKTETVIKARKITDLPIFLSGGITLNNLIGLMSTGANGVAVISGILYEKDPELAAKNYKKKLLNI